MRPNPVKQTLLAGGVSLGTFVFEFDSPGISRIAGVAGAEFLIFDMEHTGWSVETIRRLIAVTPPAGPMPFVRVPASEYHFIARVLDSGAMGVMVPMVESAEQAERIVRAAKYPPAGRRGAAFGIAHDGYDGGDIMASMQTANENTLMIAQIETRAGLDDVDAIAAVKGVDVLWIGHFDLTNSLGIPGEFEHPEFQAAVDRVLEACRKHDKVPAFMTADAADGQALLDRGFRAIAYGGDLWLYQNALREGLAALRTHGEG
ncbi:MAG: HpcH/HpaI aldolase/citrate lyase family protein, partial [Planctomycetaceae bacterium]